MQHLILLNVFCYFSLPLKTSISIVIPFSLLVLCFLPIILILIIEVVAGMTIFNSFGPDFAFEGMALGDAVFRVREFLLIDVGFGGSELFLEVCVDGEPCEWGFEFVFKLGDSPFDVGLVSINGVT